ncbi:MAG: hypothetical protein J6M53_07580, partial [Bacteroidaceae bacterium]|nr:hypothetical protein [Bacteroidaceae bacterium]
MPFQGALAARHVPRALPWAVGLLAFQAVLPRGLSLITFYAFLFAFAQIYARPCDAAKGAGGLVRSGLHFFHGVGHNLQVHLRFSAGEQEIFFVGEEEFGGLSGGALFGRQQGIDGVVVAGGGGCVAPEPGGVGGEQSVGGGLYLVKYKKKNKKLTNTSTS